MPGQPENVSDGTGRRIGSVVEVAAVEGRRRHWRAVALDGVELGAHARRIDAEGAVFDDWVDGCPRGDPTPAELAFWRAGGHPPWKRVWRAGIDVTDDDPETWPRLWREGLDGRRSRLGRGRHP